MNRSDKALFFYLIAATVILIILVIFFRSEWYGGAKHRMTKKKRNIKSHPAIYIIVKDCVTKIDSSQMTTDPPSSDIM